MNPDDLEDESQFIQSLQGDDLAVVIRAHIYLENQLGRFIQSNVVDPDSLPRLQFAGKCDLAISLGLPKPLNACLRKFGKLRNKFAHDLGYSLSKSDVRELLGTLDKTQREILNTCYENTHQILGNEEFGPFSSLPEIDQFKLVVIVVFEALSYCCENPMTT